ncbi:MAG: zinc-dependent alcohol dehydrogenase family protein [Candidatus Limnocylindrales bacterium]
MKALRFHGPHDLRLEDVPDPTPGPGEIRIRPVAVGICGTDIHILDGTFGSRPPVILGHEVAGRIEAVGRDVRYAREGDLVTVEPHRYCGVCRYCRLGREHLCLDKEAFGVHLSGGMAELQVIPERIAYRLPDGMDPRIGALAEPLSCCVHAMDRLAPRSGTSIVIFGAGPAGLILVALSRLAGLTPIVVVEPDSARRDSAVMFGADTTVDPSGEGWEDGALAIVGGAGFDYVVEAVGSPRVLESAIPLAARQGTILVFGVANPGETAAIKPQEVFVKELTILGTVINPFTHHRAVELLPLLGLDRLGIRTFPLEAHAEAFAAHQQRAAAKVQFAPQGQ